ncbi:MAG: DUF5666 domain-containing protein [Acidimicrobiales bacterium]
MSQTSPPEPASPWDPPPSATSPSNEATAPAGRTGWKQWAAAGAVAAVVAVGAGVGISLAGGGDGGSVAAAGPGGAAAVAGYGGPGGMGFPGGMGTTGTISAIDGSTITVEATAFGSSETTTMTVETSGDTTVTESVAGTVSDLAAGDNVVVMGATADGVVTAERIVDSGDVAAAGPGMGPRPDGDGDAQGGGTGMGLPGRTASESGSGSSSGAPAGAPAGGPDGDRGVPTMGTISSIDGDTVVVATADGTKVTVKTSDATTVTVTRAISVEDLAKGDTIMVTGTTSGTTVTAESIRKGELGMGRGFGGGPGQAPPAGGAPRAD